MDEIKLFRRQNGFSLLPADGGQVRLHLSGLDSIAVPVFAVWLNLTNTVSE